MKIAITFNHLNFSDGVSKSAINLANILSENGDEVTLIPIYEFDKKIKNCVDKKINIRSIFGFYFRGLGKIVGLLPEKFLYKIFIKEKYDIEIAYQYGIATKIIASSLNKKAKHIAWMHTYDEGLFLRDYYLKMDIICCVSKEAKERLLKELNYILPVYCCYNFIDSKKIYENSKEEIEIEIEEKEICFISVGRHSPEKGYKRLLKCVKKLKDEDYNFKLILVGDGPQHKELLEDTKKLKIDDKVIFVGKTYNPHKYTSKADCFLVTSLSEGYSTAATEAIILNIPLLTTNVGGAREIIEMSEVGMIVNSTEEDIYKGMKKILDNQSLIENWKEKLKNTKKKFFSDIRKKEILEIFKIIKK